MGDPVLGPLGRDGPNVAVEFRQLGADQFAFALRGHELQLERQPDGRAHGGLVQAGPERAYLVRRQDAVALVLPGRRLDHGDGRGVEDVAADGEVEHAPHDGERAVGLDGRAPLDDIIQQQDHVPAADVLCFLPTPRRQHVLGENPLVLGGAALARLGPLLQVLGNERAGGRSLRCARRGAPRRAQGPGRCPSQVSAVPGRI